MISSYKYKAEAFILKQKNTCQNIKTLKKKDLDKWKDDVSVMIAKNT